MEHLNLLTSVRLPKASRKSDDSIADHTKSVKKKALESVRIDAARTSMFSFSRKENNKM